MAKGRQVEMTPYTGKHSAGPVANKPVGLKDTAIKTDYAGKGKGAPASSVGGSLSRKGKAEITPYGGC